MPTRFEGCHHKYFHHFFGVLQRNETRGKAYDICVVVLSGHAGDFIPPAYGGPDARVFIGRDPDAVGAPAK
jgi:hypothetical protein